MLGVFLHLLPFHFIMSGFYYMVITVFGTIYAIIFAEFRNHGKTPEKCWYTGKIWAFD